MKRPVRGDLGVSETLENQAVSVGDPTDQVSIGVNESGTVSGSGTELTQPSPASFTVPPNLKQHMRILRNKFGPSSKIGRCASNTEGAIDNLSNLDRHEVTAAFQRTFLELSIKRQLTTIARLAAK